MPWVWGRSEAFCRARAAFEAFDGAQAVARVLVGRLRAAIRDSIRALVAIGAYREGGTWGVSVFRHLLLHLGRELSRS